MAEVLSPGSMMMGGGDGLFGGAGAGGLIGGLILGSLLRNNGNFFGNDGVVPRVGLGADRIPPEQSTANMQLMQSIGAVDKAVAVSTASMEASQATQTLGITTQLASVASSLTNNLNQTNTNVMATANETQKVVMQGQSQINQNIMENRYQLAQDIANDGEKTRALITRQYEEALNRQLAVAQNEIIELRGDRRLQEATRGIEVNTTNNINQMQQQQQQQQQFGQLANLIWGLSNQIIRNNDSAINVGSGVLTSTPTNTNTNIR